MADAQMRDVDAHPDTHRATEADEEEILESLYGPPDRDGFYRGLPPGEEGASE